LGKEVLMRLPGFFGKFLEKRRIKQKRKDWWEGAKKKSKQELKSLFPNPDPDLVDLIARAYLDKSVTALDIYLPVYSNGKCDSKIKVILARHFLELAKDARAGKAIYYWRGSNDNWTNPLDGRVRHLIFIGAILPELRSEIEKVVRNYLSDSEVAYFSKHKPW